MQARALTPACLARTKPRCAESAGACLAECFPLTGDVACTECFASLDTLTRQLPSLCTQTAEAPRGACASLHQLSSFLLALDVTPALAVLAALQPAQV